jgi:hypothetical protein
LPKPAEAGENVRSAPFSAVPEATYIPCRSLLRCFHSCVCSIDCYREQTREVADARLLRYLHTKPVCRVHWLTVGVVLQIQEQQQALSLRPELHDVIQLFEEMGLMDKP